ncbi:MAG TPA: protein translocase subunit SecD [Gemmatimonadales bacterium]|jgi:preprotein translocase subunit SecD
MFDSVRTRLIIIGLLVVASIGALWPRSVTTRIEGRDQVMHDTVVREVNLKYGLDLQGGIHMALELDESGGKVANCSDAIDRALKVIRTRVDEFGVSEPLIQKQGACRIVVELAGITDPERARAIVKRSAFLEFEMTDKDGLFAQALRPMDRALSAAGINETTVGRQLSDSAGGAARRAPATPAPTTVENLLSQSHPDTAKLAVRDTAKAGRAARGARADTTKHDTAATDTTAMLNGPLTSLLNAGGMPGEYMVLEEKYPIVDRMLHDPVVQRLIPRGIIFHWAADPTSRGARAYRGLYALQEKPIMTGEYLTDATARLDPNNQAIVEFQLSRRGGRTFERETGRHVNDFMAIVLDHKVQSRPPVIKGQIGARGEIELGSASLQEAQDLALVLKAGSLPAPLMIVEDRTVGASLGKDSIRDAEIAGLVGIGLVIIIMIGYYHFAGVLSIIALGFYVLFTMGGLAAFDTTLTLPGLAGFILSIGIAVDANVLIFERIREELVHGKSVRLAIDAGFAMAMNAIVDSNVSTILTAACLFWFGTGPVKGFAVTLIVGILASMITSIFVVRTFFMMYLAKKTQLQTLSI